MSDILDEAKRLLAGATPAPWHPWERCGWEVRTSPDDDPFDACVALCEGEGERDRHNAALIARAPTLIAELVAMVEAERKRFDELWGDDLTAEEEAKIAADKRDPVVRAEIVASTGRFVASIKIGEIRERARIVEMLRERAAKSERDANEHVQSGEHWRVHRAQWIAFGNAAALTDLADELEKTP